MGKRKFDHDEARRLYHEEGLSMSEIGRRFGVSHSSIRFALKPETRPRWHCFYCGAPCAWTPRIQNKHHVPRCKQCAAMQQATTVRDDELLCYRCQKWKPDEAFHRGAKLIARRQRRSICKTCDADRHLSPIARALKNAQ